LTSAGLLMEAAEAFLRVQGLKPKPFSPSCGTAQAVP